MNVPVYRGSAEKPRRLSRYRPFSGIRLFGTPLSLLSVLMAMIALITASSLIPGNPAYATEAADNTIAVDYRFWDGTEPIIASTGAPVADHSRNFRAPFTIEGDRMIARVNSFPHEVDLTQEGCIVSTFLNMSGGETPDRQFRNITAECPYNKDAGTVSIPRSYQEQNVTTVVTQLQTSTIMLPVEVSAHIEGSSEQTDATTTTYGSAESPFTEIDLADLLSSTAGGVQSITVTQGGIELDGSEDYLVSPDGLLSILRTPAAGAVELNIVMVPDNRGGFHLAEATTVPHTAGSVNANSTIPANDLGLHTAQRDTGISTLSLESPTVGETFTGQAWYTVMTRDRFAELGIDHGYGFMAAITTMSSAPDLWCSSSMRYGHTYNGEKYSGTYDVPYYNFGASLPLSLLVGECDGAIGNTPWEDVNAYECRIDVTVASISGSTVYCDFHVNSPNTNRYQGCVGSFSYSIPYGNIDLDKDTSNSAASDNNENYRLDGAEYGIYRDEGCTDLWFSKLTDENGYFACGNDIPAGTYWVREIKPSKGFALDTTTYRVDVESGHTRRVNGGIDDAAGRVYDAPQMSAIEMLLQKRDAETGLPTAQGNASLAQAEFTVSHYTNRTATGSATRTWVFKTDEQGRVLFDEAHKVSGDDFYRSSDGTISLPFGSLKATETKAPKGYLLPESGSPDAVTVVQINGNGSTDEVAPLLNSLTVKDRVIRGGASIQKRDAETGLDTALGSGTLAGVEFTITNESAAAVTIEDESIAPGAIVATVITDETGCAQTAADFLPYGTYGVRETVAPQGYNGTDRFVTFTIDTAGKVVELDGSDAFKNQIKRGDFKFQKKNGSTGQHLANIPFRLTSVTTGESHIIVTDENGMFDSSASWLAHSDSTNANDAAVTDDGVVDESKLNNGAGIWFGQTQAGSSAEVNDRLGSLPYDSYSLEELSCSANKGLDLLNISNLAIKRDAVCLDLGTLNDVPRTVSIHTTARDSGHGGHYPVIDTQMQLIDTIEYVGLTPGATYTMTGTLVDTSTGVAFEDADGPVTASTTFVPETASGSVAVEFQFDGSGFEGEALVVFETCTDEHHETVAEHKDLSSEDQTVYPVEPRIATVVRDASDGDHYLSSGNDLTVPGTIIDAVAYEGLIPNKEYTVSGTCVSVDSGEPIVVDGEPVTGSTTFTPKTSSGTVDVPFDMTAWENDGSSIVVFEQLQRNEIPVAKHEDPAATSQTFYTPTIGTTLADTEGNKVLAGEGIITLIDTVEYHGLVPGNQYSVTGILYDKDTGAAIEENGEVLSSTTLFTPEQPDGTVEVPFVVEASILAGKTVVAFEDVSFENKSIAVHADLDDEAQTVVFERPPVIPPAPDQPTPERTPVDTTPAKEEVPETPASSAAAKTFDWLSNNFFYVLFGCAALAASALYVRNSKAVTRRYARRFVRRHL